MNAGFDFVVGASVDAGIQFDLGTARTRATETSTTKVTATSISTNMEPIPFQWFKSVGSRSTQEVQVPLKMLLECEKEDGSKKQERIGGTLTTEGTTTIEVTLEDLTNKCKQSY